MENERIIYTACPLCESPDIVPFAVINCTGHGRWREPLEPTMSWKRCGPCDHIFTEGYFTDAALDILFTSTMDQQTVGNNIEQQRGVSAEIVERVAGFTGLPDGHLWIDVGFGSGSLLMTAKEFGFDVFGLDLRKKNVDDIEQQFGIPAFYGILEDAASGAGLTTKPTVISMADVVEHVPYPSTVLRSARELIDENGILFISMPNCSAPLWHYWNSTDQNPYWHEIEHYHNFTRERLYAILRETGFEPVHYNISSRYRGCMEVLAKPSRDISR